MLTGHLRKPQVLHKHKIRKISLRQQKKTIIFFTCSMKKTILPLMETLIVWSLGREISKDDGQNDEEHHNLH